MRVTLDEYGKKRAAFLIVHSICQAKLVGCTGEATDVHHKAGRGENHLKISTWLAVCRSCHNWIEVNPTEAKELGFSENRLKTTE
jgi:cytochrome c553